MTELQVLHRGGKSELARQLQAATNRRLVAKGLGALRVKEDGVVGAKTLNAVRKAAWALGALSSSYEPITKTGTISIGVQRMIRNPGLRSGPQLERARVRRAQTQKARKRRADAAAKEKAATGSSSRSKAVNTFLAKVGTVESPPGSNGGGVITVMESYWGFGRVPWCGIAAGYHAKKFGGVDQLRSDVASVSAIEQHARHGDPGYGRWVGRGGVDELLQGAFIVIGGSGVHVAMKVDDWSGGGAETVEGNTSFGRNGSQSNGGCIAHRFRSADEIYGGAAMNYPNN
jgi:hypothetical protein